MTDPQKKPRPSSIPCTVTKITTGCGNMYISVGRVDGKIFEVFATLGKSGGCAKSQLEGITRCITVGLRYDVPVEEYIRQLADISCPMPVISKGKNIKSCADAISKVLQKKED